MKNLFFIILIVATISSCKKTNDTPKTIAKDYISITDSLNTQLDSIYDNGAIVGFSAAIVSTDSVLYNKGFGYADVTNEKAYTTETIQNIGSISKTFIGIALLKAQELGKIQLNDPINKHLPFKVTNPNHPSNAITIRQLATHTSSIVDTDWYGKSYVMLEKEHPNTTIVLDYFSGPEDGMPLKDYLQKVLSPKGAWYEPEIFETYAPSTTFEYTNIGATLAALVIENATGSSFSDFTTDHILKPLEMSASGWSNDAIDISKRSKAYVHKDTLIAAYKLITYPDGGMITSTNNLAYYLSELIKGYNGNGTLLSKESYQELFKKQLTKNQLPEKAQDANIGIFMDYSKHGIGHNGGDPGVLTFMYFNPKSNIGKIVFINTDYDTNPDVLKTFSEIWKTLGSYEEKFK